MTSSTLAPFADAFVGKAGASGMVGTEVALDQGVASLFMERFLTGFVAGASAGEALRAARWDLVRRGNVMGLAYTAYCLSNLRIRATEENARSPPRRPSSTRSAPPASGW